MTVSDEESRIDETWHRLREWSYGQPPSERLAALILDDEGFKDIEPSHPLGGKDGGRDGECTRDGSKWIWAVYFARGQQDFNTIKKKLEADIAAARKHAPAGIAFVTNQELRLSERRDLRELGGDINIELFHLERIASILDRTRMAPIRQKFLKIAPGRPPMIVKASVHGAAVFFTDEEPVIDVLVELHEKTLRERSDEAKKRDRESPLLVNLPAMTDLHKWYTGSAPEPPKVLSEDEISKAVIAHREAVQAGWDWSRGYLAGAAFPGIQFTIENAETAFLNNVEIVLTFAGTRGVDWVSPDTFSLEKLQDSEWTPAWGMDPNLYLPVQFKNYPVAYAHNDEGDLEVTITLDTLRPRKVWVSDDTDIVLVLRDDGIDEVAVTYTVTADGYNELFEGGPIHLGVQRVSALDTLANVLNSKSE